MKSTETAVMLGGILERLLREHLNDSDEEY